MTATADPSNSCPSCGATSTGKFCSECGSPLNVSCVTCGTALVRSARFCQECGAAAPVRGHAARARSTLSKHHRTRLIAGVASVVLGAGVVLFAIEIGGRAVNRTSGATATQEGAVISAPDISGMSPRERAARLYDRVMRLHEQRKMDSVAFFAPMALGAYQAISDLDDDGRYDMARIAMVVGAQPLAKAQADTILRRNPTHLLGLLLAADLARGIGADSEASKLEARFVTAAPLERRRRLPEYDAHANEIDSALRRLSKGP